MLHATCAYFTWISSQYSYHRDGGAGPDLANQSSPIKTTAGGTPDSATEINLIKVLLAFGLIVIQIEARRLITSRLMTIVLSAG